MEKRILDLPRPPRILVVEDSPITLQLFKRIFSQDYIVVTANDGKKGLEKAKEAYFDVIISDIDLPAMNGLEFFQALSEHDPNINRRFLFLSGLITEARQVFLNANQVPFFWKPVGMLVLKHKLIEIIEGNRQRIELPENSGLME